jgi:hypothetical protein
MWNNKNRRGTLEACQFSLSEWNDAPTEEVPTYNASESTATDQPDSSSASSAVGEMNIDSIYDAIKNEK